MTQYNNTSTVPKSSSKTCPITPDTLIPNRKSTPLNYKDILSPGALLCPPHQNHPRPRTAPLSDLPIQIPPPTSLTSFSSSPTTSLSSRHPYPPASTSPIQNTTSPPPHTTAALHPAPSSTPASSGISAGFSMVSQRL